MQKKWHWRIAITLIGAAFFLSKPTPLMTAPVEQVDQFAADITLTTNNTFTVRETIAYDFGSLRRHGIFRVIPTSYITNGLRYTIGIQDVHVTDDSGSVMPFTVTRDRTTIYIRVGDPDITTTGQHVYILTYTVKRAITYGDENAALHWNVTGHGWTVGMNNVSATVHLPQAVASSTLTTLCYHGRFGSTRPCDNIIRQADTDETVTSVQFIQSKQNPGEGLTVTVQLPSGIIIPPSMFERSVDFARDNWPIGIPIILFITLLTHWYFHGRDPKGSGTIITQFTPPEDLTPAEAGTILDVFINRKELTAEIIALAMSGYLTIRYQHKTDTERYKGYILERSNKSEANLQGWQQELLRALFPTMTVRLNDLQKTFGIHFKNLQKKLYAALTERGYFYRNPHRNLSLLATAGSAFALTAYASWQYFYDYPYIIIIAMVCVLIVYSFLYISPKRTPKGVTALEHIRGLKEYIRVAEIDRIHFHNPPTKTVEYFEQLLPYAVAFGLEKKWAEQFSELTTTTYQPTWYAPAHPTANLMDFTSEIGRFMTAANAALPISTRSSVRSGMSGGFSGGGFGGGRGGSW